MPPVRIKNSDGYYTPGYDVNRRVNDAWGVRDIMRSGALYTGGYQAWMTKVRHEEHRVFPPLPADSMLRERYTENGEYAPENAVYTLRPLPQAAYEHEGMARYIGDKGTDPWPEEVPDTDWKSFARWAKTDSFVKSLSIAYRFDGNLSGWSFVFPLFIFKNYEDPLAGGYILHRLYTQSKYTPLGNINDFGWMLHYTPSASRWIDSYFSAGIELHNFPSLEGSETSIISKTSFVFETGIKFRVNLFYTPLKFLTWITDFWGVRIGIKNVGALDIDRFSYVIEIGAGTW
ncbi:MAG: hypothetical protein JRI43_00045 [Deltaproteobacteria bacterium]|nr:hypothetical protein [Deltaproteobacteria bacterium]